MECDIKMKEETKFELDFKEYQLLFKDEMEEIKNKIEENNIIDDEDSFIEEEPEWTPTDSDEWEPMDEKEMIIEEEDEIDIKEVKIDTFRDINSIDEETAILLYDNGFVTVDTLYIATVKDLAKIEGIKKSTAKRIKKEIEEVIMYE